MDEVGKRFKLNDLPKELVKELVLEDLSDLIIDIIKSYGGWCDKNEILVGLYNKTSKIYKRVNISNRLTIMKKKGLIENLNKSGIYKLKENE